MEKLIGQFHDESTESYLKQVEALNEQIEMIGRKRKPTIEHLIEASICGATIELIRHFHLGYYDKDKVTNSLTNELRKKIMGLVARRETEEADIIVLGLTNSVAVNNALFEMRNIILDLSNSLISELINLEKITELKYSRIKLLEKINIADILDRSKLMGLNDEPASVFLSGDETIGTPIFEGFTQADETGERHSYVHNIESNRVASPLEPLIRQLIIIRGYNIFSLALSKEYRLKSLYLPITFKDNRAIEFYLSKLEENAELINKSIIENKDKGPDFRAIYDFVKEYNVNFNPLSETLIQVLENPHITNETYSKDIIKEARKTIRNSILELVQSPYFIIRDLGEQLYDREKQF